MLDHKFHVGQTVFLNPSQSQNLPGGAYTITKKLPEPSRVFVGFNRQYVR